MPDPDADPDAVEANIRRAEVSLASNVYPQPTAAEARSALETARRAHAAGDDETARAASDTALRILAEALR
ncbi:hypothetical protein ACWDYJ_07140 [Streptomyces sp. NPDC003042]